jgi:hypothetical protein
VTEPAQYKQYETDEFDIDLVTGLPWMIGAALSLAVVVGMYSLVGGGDLNLPGGTDDPSPPAGETTTTPPTTPPPTSASPTTPPPSPDKSVELVVLNSTDIRGLAARAAEQLETEGWTVTKAANYDDSAPPTTVFYASEELAATAEAVAAVVGGKAALDADETDAITVVLGSDYTPPA